MVEYTQYKTVTCDLCGKQKRFEPVYEFPYHLGYKRVSFRSTSEVVKTYEVCEDCYGEMVNHARSMDKRS